MVKRYCPKCGAEFNQKCHYDNHINRKFDCSLNNTHLNELNEEKNDKNMLCGFVQDSCRNVQNEKIQHENLIMPNNILFPCSYCNKSYSSKSTLTRHLKENCKIKKNNDNEKENIFKLLLEKDKENKENKERIEKLEKQNKILMDKIDKLICLKENTKTINNNQVINNQSNTINNLSNTNNIVMVNFGKEDLSIIDNKIFIDRVIKKNINGVKIPDEVLKIIHFNPMYPQLSNIYISDINRDKCMVYENGEWILSNVDNIPQIMDKICIFSNEQINTLKEKYPDNKQLQDRIKVIEKYNNMIDEDYLEELRDDIEENKDTIKRCENFKKNTQNTIKKTLYNEGKKLKKTIKK
jgi:hypothetical protein